MNESRLKEIVAQYYRQQGYEIYEEVPIIRKGPIIDLIVSKKKNALYLIECKGSVGITDLVRGLGQCIQYNGLKQEIEELSTAKTILIIPEDSVAYFNYLYIPKDINVYYVNIAKKGIELKDLRAEIDITSTKKEFAINGVFFNEGINSIQRLIQVLETIDRTTKNSLKEEKILPTDILVDELLKNIRKKDGSSFAEKHIRVNLLLTLYSYKFIDENNRLTSTSKRILSLNKKNKTQDLYFEIYNIFEMPIRIIWRAIFLYCKNQQLNPFQPNKITAHLIVDYIKKMFITDELKKKGYIGVKYLNNHQRISNYLGLMEDLQMIERNNRGISLKTVETLYPDIL